MTHSWDPGRYLRFAGERGRPFLELLARVGAEDPGLVVDLGCGPGNLTALLPQRWPTARVVGLDSSVEMLAAARREVGERVEWVEAEIGRWRPDSPVDVLVSNAALQWVPGHLGLLERLVAQVAPGGWFAMQVSGNFGEPSHTIRRELAGEPRYAAYTSGVAVPSSHEPAVYLAELARLGCRPDVWETTYLHVLRGEDAVFDWVSATGARPTLQALPPGLREQFAAEFRARLREAYPVGPVGVVLPFRRVFAVAQRR